MTSIALPSRQILLPRLEFPAWVRRIGDPLKMLSPLAGSLTPLGVSGGAAHPTLIYDTFTDSDGVALPSHTIAPTNTPATSWSAQSGTATISSNRAISSSSPAIYTVNAGQFNVTVSLTGNLQGPGGSIGVVLRWTNSSNFWFVRFTGTGFGIFEVNGGTQTQRASTSVSLLAGTDYPLVVVASGTSITATVNGGNQISYNNATLNQTVTTHGLRFSLNDVVDNFRVSAL